MSLYFFPHSFSLILIPLFRSIAFRLFFRFGLSDIMWFRLFIFWKFFFFNYDKWFCKIVLKMPWSSLSWLSKSPLRSKLLSWYGVFFICDLGEGMFAHLQISVHLVMSTKCFTVILHRDCLFGNYLISSLCHLYLCDYVFS